MKVAIIAGLFAVGNMEINASQGMSKLLSVLKYREAATVLRRLWWCMWLLPVFGAWGQSVKWVLRSHGLDAQHSFLRKNADTTRVTAWSNEMIERLRRQGFWLASLDSTGRSDDTLHLYFFQGRKFDRITAHWNDSFPLPKKLQWTETHSPQALQDKIDEMITWMENHGYPFASITIDSTQVLHDRLLVYLHPARGMAITYDSLRIAPKPLLKPAFLSRYLNLVYGREYDQRTMDGIPPKMQRFPFLSLQKAATQFRLKRAAVTCHVSPKKVNYFDGILGLVPKREGGGVELSGELKLSLKNLLRSAKSIDIHWTSLRPGSQQLKASYFHPLLLRSPLDFSFDFHQIRQDTLYANRTLRLAFAYHPTHPLQLRLSYENLLGSKLENQKSESGDFTIAYYGLSATWQQLDDSYSPKQGLKAQAAAQIGRKQPQGTAAAAPVAASTQYRLQAKVAAYQPVGSRSVVHLAAQSGLLFNERLYLNDLFRVGGLNSLRGFNELAFFASQFALFTAEWRYYLDAKSYLVAFFDQGFMSYNLVSGSFADEPSGMGVGMQFSTTAGSFEILYGLGRRDRQSFTFDTSKIHFGYTAFF